jgi:GT2 family glycosyltransferase
MKQDKVLEEFRFIVLVVCMFRESRDYPSVSVVVVNFNGGELLRQCLFTLLGTDYPDFEVVVVDNASTDGSLEEAERCFVTDSRVRLIRNNENLGHAKGCNIGAKMTEGRYVVFLDSDTEFRSGDWLLELICVMEDDECVGLAQAKLVLAEDEKSLDYVCVGVDALGTWAATYGLQEEQLRKNFEVLAASSGCCIVRREVFDEAGGFDSDYFIYDDDTDLSLRVRLLGYRVLLVPSAVVVHRGGVLRGLNSGTLYHSSKNRVRTALKTYELKNVWWRFSVLSFFTIVVSASFVVMGKIDEAKATFMGLLSSLRDFRGIWRKRLWLQSKRRIKDSELVNRGFVRNDFRSTLQDVKIKLKHMH